MLSKLFSLIKQTFIVGIAIFMPHQLWAETKFLASIYSNTIGVKWYPGHYYHINGGSPRAFNKEDPTMDKIYSELNAENSGLVGIQLRLNWRDLEPTKDNYLNGFNIIDGHLKRLKPNKKKLFLFIAYRGEKSGYAENGIMPYYLNDDIYGINGGIATYTTVNGDIGEHAKLWHPMVRDRFIKLLKALGDRYNKDFTFVGLGLPETSVPKTIGISTAQMDAYYQNLLLFNKVLRKAFPNTITTQFINYTRDALQTFAPALRDMGAAIGGPDTWLDDPGVNDDGNPDTIEAAYSYYKKFAGQIALTPSVMSGNYERTCHDANDPANRNNPTIEELLLFAKNTLKANIIFWTRDSREPMLNYLKLLTYLKDVATINPKDSRITLNKACPTKYIHCLIQK